MKQPFSSINVSPDTLDQIADWMELTYDTILTLTEDNDFWLPDNPAEIVKSVRSWKRAGEMELTVTFSNFTRSAIRYGCARADLSLHGLAKKAGVSHATLYRFMNDTEGGKLSIASLDKLFAVLDIRMAYE